MPRIRTVVGAFGQPIKQIKFTKFENTARDAEEAQAAIYAAASLVTIVRQERNSKLTACDWTQFSDAQLTIVQKDAWKIYRQTLRDVPKQSGFPGSVTWPKQP